MPLYLVYAGARSPGLLGNHSTNKSTFSDSHNSFGAKTKLSVAAEASNPSIWRLRQEDRKLKVSLGYIVRPFLKENL